MFPKIPLNTSAIPRYLMLWSPVGRNDVFGGVGQAGMSNRVYSYAAVAATNQLAVDLFRPEWANINVLCLNIDGTQCGTAVKQTHGV